MISNNSIKLGLLASVLMVSACSSVETRKYGEPQTGTPQEVRAINSISGVNYYLPKRMAKFSISRTAIKKGDVDQKLALAKIVLKGAEESAAAKKMALEVILEKLSKIQAGVPDSYKNFYEAEYKKVKAAYDKAIVKLNSANAAKKAAEDAKKQFEKSDACAVVDYAVKLEVLAPEPDLSQPYRATVPTNWFTSKDISLTVTEKGLLSSADATSVGHTADVLVALARTVGFFSGGFSAASAPTFAGVKGLAISPSAPAPDGKPIICPEASKLNEVVFLDLADTVEVKSLNKTLSTTFKAPIELEVTSSLSAKNTRKVDQASKITGADLKDHRSIGGLLYRVNIPYRIRILKKDSKAAGGEVVIQSAVHFLPNKSPISVIPMNSSLFGETKNNLTFKDGILTSRKLVEPSAALSIVKIPLDMVDAVFESLAKIVPFATKQTQDQSALINAQIELIKAQQSLKEAQQQQPNTD